MITVQCILCQFDFEVSLEEFLSDTEFICPICAKAALDFIINFEPIDN